MSSNMELKINWSGPQSAVALRAASLPYGSFVVAIKIRKSSVSLPLTVEILETPDPQTQLGTLTLGGGKALILNQSVTIRNRYNPLHEYSVNSLSSFQMKWPYIYFQVRMKSKYSQVETFKGSTVTITVSNGSGFRETEQIRILYGNPNNHYHWRNEPTFVDAWYFKCVHVDPQSRKATPFFFLYGINDPNGGTNAESFVYCGNNGSISLESNLHTAQPGSHPTPLEIQKWDKISIAKFSGETYHKLNTTIDQVFKATDMGCEGIGTTNNQPPSPGNTISWNLKFTKVHSQVLSDYNPLSPFKWILEKFGPWFWTPMPGSPLYSFLVKAPFVSAYYMSQSMNCLVSGTVNWKGKTYTFQNDKGYQDENWGASGFPHPYVWMQANNFVDSIGNPLHDTSLVALYTPGMPVASSYSGATEIGGILFRHARKTYRFFKVDKALFWPLDDVADAFIDTGPFTCFVDLMQSGTKKTVNMANKSEVNTKLGPFVPLSGRPAGQEVKPVKWTLESRNDSGWLPATGDRIKITFECDEITGSPLPGPLGGAVVDGVTKETLQAHAKVELTPLSGSTQTFHSDFAAAEYGD